MKTLAEIENIIKKNKPSLLKEYCIKEIGIFGSIVKNEHTDNSDVDILVEFDEVPDLLKFINLENKLEEMLGIKVDLVQKKGIRPELKDYILKEVVYI